MKKFSMKEIEKLENKQYEKCLNRIHRAIRRCAKLGQYSCIVECCDNAMAARIMRHLRRESLTARRYGYSYIEITWDVLATD